MERLTDHWTALGLTPSEASVMRCLEEAASGGATLAVLATEGLGYVSTEAYEDRAQMQVRKVVSNVRKKLGAGAVVTFGGRYHFGLEAAESSQDGVA